MQCSAVQCSRRHRTLHKRTAKLQAVVGLTLPCDSHHCDVYMVVLEAGAFLDRRSTASKCHRNSTQLVPVRWRKNRTTGPVSRARVPVFSTHAGVAGFFCSPCVGALLACCPAGIPRKSSDQKTLTYILPECIRSRRFDLRLSAYIGDRFEGGEQKPLAAKGLQGI